MKEGCILCNLQMFSPLLFLEKENYYTPIKNSPPAFKKMILDRKAVLF